MFFVIYLLCALHMELAASSKSTSSRNQRSASTHRKREDKQIKIDWSIDGFFRITFGMEYDAHWIYRYSIARKSKHTQWIAFAAEMTARDFIFRACHVYASLQICSLVFLNGSIPFQCTCDDVCQCNKLNVWILYLCVMYDCGNGVLSSSLMNVNHFGGYCATKQVQPLQQRAHGWCIFFDTCLHSHFPYNIHRTICFLWTHPYLRVGAKNWIVNKTTANNANALRLVQ